MVWGETGTRTARGILPTQRDVLRDVMLTAGKYGAWMTLRELARLTRYGETSISAATAASCARRSAADTSWKKRVRKPEVVSSERTLCGVGVPVDAAARIRRKAPEIWRRRQQ